MKNNFQKSRYFKQTLLREIGAAGQERLARSSVMIAGCGALGSVIAGSLVRAGVGLVRIVDRDYIDLDNLHRQTLYDEDDIARGLPKAEAAARKLRLINSEIIIEPVIADIVPENIEGLMGGIDLVMDGTDNFETRFLINDASVKLGKPWIYGGVVATYGMTFTFIPGETPCFQCFIGKMPPPGTSPTCDTIGVLGTAAGIVASIEATEAIKLLTGNRNALLGKLVYVDPWNGIWKLFSMAREEKNCPVCGERRFQRLDARPGPRAVSLCGRDSIQISSSGDSDVQLAGLADRLSALGDVSYNEYMLRLKVDKFEITLFQGGRAIIKGTTDPALARSLYSKYIGI